LDLKIKQEYFYFISGLPNISFEDTKQVFTPENFRIEAKAQLSDSDFQLLDAMHLPQDFDNLLIALYKAPKEANPEGIFSAGDWENYLAYLKATIDNPRLECPSEFAGLPLFVHDTICRILQQEEMQPIMQTEQELLVQFYAWAAEHSNQFIVRWFGYDAHLRNVLTAIAGRKFELPYAQYLIGEGETVEKLAKSHAADFGLGKADELFETLIRIYEQNNILFREKGYDILRWKWIDNQNFFNYFNIDRILGYYCKLRILSRWLKADPNMGKEVFHDTLDALENSFSFPEDFNIKSVKKH